MTVLPSAASVGTSPESTSTRISWLPGPREGSVKDEPAVRDHVGAFGLQLAGRIAVGVRDEPRRVGHLAGHVDLQG